MLANRAVEIEEARSTFRAHSRTAELAQRRDAIGARSVGHTGGAESSARDVTKPSVHCADRGIRLDQIAVGARVSARAAAGVGVLRGCEDGDGEAAPLGQPEVDVPAAQDQVHGLAGASAELLALAEGNIEHTAGGE